MSDCNGRMLSNAFGYKNDTTVIDNIREAFKGGSMSGCCDKNKTQCLEQSKPDMQRQIIDQLIADVEEWKQKYNDLNELVENASRLTINPDFVANGR